jgi:hypothetical protein
MVGKDKTAKSGKSKKALEAEFAAALTAADLGERLTCASSNTTKGGSKHLVTGRNPLYDHMGNYINPPEEKRAAGKAAPVSKKEIREAKKAAKLEGKAGDASAAPATLDADEDKKESADADDSAVGVEGVEAIAVATSVAVATTAVAVAAVP